MNVATTPLRDMTGAIAGTIVVIEDISARVQLEEQLQISEKMASIGFSPQAWRTKSTRR